MALTLGTRLGPYEIVSLLGVGGMGEVYRATDSNLKRAVAIKVLPASVAGDADRLVRFQREAEVLGALNHPNIAAIYGLERSGDMIALVMELVEGDDLSQRIARGAMPIDEVLPIAKQIADALEAAHEQGIIHRDLKPANIKVRADGTVKVLDFGLAKAMEPAGRVSDVSQSPTITIPAMTQAGMILGTAAYMSPEQARGKPVDKRADIWAFGCVLYEMLSGRAAFARDTVTDTLAAIVERAPDWSALSSDTPGTVRRLLTRCLEKDLRRRMRDIGDARVELEEAPLLTPEAVAGPRQPDSNAGVWGRRAIWSLTALGCGALLATAFVVFRGRAPQAAPPVRFAISVDGQTGDGTPVPSPDGRSLVVSATDASGKNRLWLRSLENDQGHWITGADDAVASGPFWSADSRWIGFYSQGRLKKISPLGGSPQTIAEVAGSGGGATWNARGDIIFAQTNRSGLFRIHESGGPAQPLTTLDSARTENSHRWPHFLPDGKHFVFTARSTAAENNAVYIGSIESGEIRRLVHVESQVSYIEAEQGKAGAFLYVREGTLFRHRFDGQNLIGEPEAIAQHLFHNTISARAGFASSPDGRVLVLREARSAGLVPSWFTHDGTPDGVLTPGPYAEPRVSPDGFRLLFDRPDLDYGNRDVWSLDVAHGTFVRLTSHRANDLEAQWSPDGQQMLFASDRKGGPALSFWIKNASGVGGEETLVGGIPAGEFDLCDWSRDGRWIALSQHGLPSGDVWIVPADGSRKAFVFFESPFSELNPRFSPDAKWIAYSSNESGRREVYVRPFHGESGGAADAIRISTLGGDYPAWTRDGQELVFIGNDFKMFSAKTSHLSAKAAIGPVPLFAACPATQPLSGALGGYPYDTAPDGRFLILCQPGQVSFVVTVNGISPQIAEK